MAVYRAGSILAPAVLTSARKSNTFQVDRSISLPSSSATTTEMVQLIIRCYLHKLQRDWKAWNSLYSFVVQYDVDWRVWGMLLAKPA